MDSSYLITERDARYQAEQRIWNEFQSKWRAVMRDVSALQGQYGADTDGWNACADVLGGMEWLLTPSERMVVVHKKSGYQGRTPAVTGPTVVAGE